MQPFLRNCWYVAGYTEEATSTPLARTILDQPLVIFRTESGAVVALDNSCPHRFAPLDKGSVVGEQIQCAYHGLRFDRTGACARLPSGEAAPPRAQVRSYPLVERHALLWIWMGDSERADRGLIPDFAYLEDPGYGWYNGYIYTQANYQLVIDNLLDLSHAEFLHPILASKGWIRRNQQRIEQTGETITVHNVAENSRVVPIMAMVMPHLSATGTNVHLARWDAPSLIRLALEFYSEGGDIIIPAAHFATPETQGSTHYFARSAHGWEIDNPQVTAQYGAGIQHVFQSEDIPILEAQQRHLGDQDLMSQHPAVLPGDSAAIRARRLLARRIRDDAGAPVMA